VNHTTPRPLVLTVAALALLGGATLAPMSPAHAAGPDVLRQLSQAIAAHSFKVVIDSRSTGANAARASLGHLHMEETLLRHGTTFRLYIYSRTVQGVNEMVYTGAHACVRQSGQRAWNCAMPTRAIAMYRDAMDPAKAMKAAGAYIQDVGPVGTKMVRGHLSEGYRFTTTMATLHTTGHGTVWIDRVTTLPVEVDTTSASTMTGARTPLVTTGTEVWSRWDDSTLTIPTVPAS